MRTLSAILRPCTKADCERLIISGMHCLIRAAIIFEMHLYIVLQQEIAWGASIYHLWRQRNARVHENQFISIDSIFYLICNDVRLRITSFQNVANNPANRDLCEIWRFPLTILRPTRDD